MPDTRPRVRFTDGVCNACTFAEAKKQIDWTERGAEFQRVVAKCMETSSGRNGTSEYDCIVPFSGGKDSATVAWKLREAGLRPLLVTYGQLLWTDVGRHNFDLVCGAGFDILYWRVDQHVSRKLARRFFIERGHPKQHYDAGVNAVPLQTAVKFGIPLVFYAEHGESEYGGRVANAESTRTRDLAEVLEHQIGDDPRNWAVDGLTEGDLQPYIYPEQADIERVGVKAYYFSHFFKWDIYENAKFARETMGFRQARNVPAQAILDIAVGEWQKPLFGQWSWWGKSDGSFEGFDSIDDKIDDLDYYMMRIKFGFGRSARMASRMIQNGHMTRAQGLELVRRYDGEWPATYLPDVLAYLGMTEAELCERVDRHRNPEIWTKESGEWMLKTPPA